MLRWQPEFTLRVFNIRNKKVICSSLLKAETLLMCEEYRLICVMTSYGGCEGAGKGLENEMNSLHNLAYFLLEKHFH